MLSKRALSAPVFTAKDNIVRLSDVYEFEVEIPAVEGTHALKLRATAPDNRDASWFSRSILLKSESTRVKLPIAHNEQRGTWRVTLTDLSTRASVGCSFSAE